MSQITKQKEVENIISAKLHFLGNIKKGVLSIEEAEKEKSKLFKEFVDIKKGGKTIKRRFF